MNQALKYAIALPILLPLLFMAIIAIVSAVALILDTASYNR